MLESLRNFLSDLSGGGKQQEAFAEDMGYNGSVTNAKIPPETEKRIGFSADERKRLIDLDYGYNNVFWHSPQDTMDKLSPKSLEIVGDTILETIHKLDQR